MSRCDEYRDLLEAWTEWWNNIGRFNYGQAPIPPLTRTSEALACLACHNVGSYEAESGPARCQVCGRRMYQ
jgi:hypothetical protein